MIGLDVTRSEEHTSELQSLRHLVCRLLLEKKKTGEHSHHHRGDAPPEHRREGPHYGSRAEKCSEVAAYYLPGCQIHRGKPDPPPSDNLNDDDDRIANGDEKTNQRALHDAATRLL